MSDPKPTYEQLQALVQQQQLHIDKLQAEIDRLHQRLDQAHRRSKRQAAPFRKTEPKPNPKTPGRKSGDQHGAHGHRPEPPPEAIDQTYEAPLPEACPHCGGGLTETEVAQQFQTEIPRKPIHRQFNVHVGCCQQCQRRVQGRHPLQTSDALGAAASQVGPDAQAAVVTLNKQAGLSHAKIADCFDTLFGIDLTRGASAQIVLRAGERLEATYEEILQETRQADRLSVDETGWRIGGHSAWLHVWVSERATCYMVDRHRHAGALEAVIGLDWEGILIHDGWSSYDRFTEAIHQQCVAHILRRAKDLAAAASGGGVRFPRQVMELFRGAIHLRNEYVSGRVSESMWASARDRYEEKLLALVLRPRGSPALQRFSDHLDAHFSDWFGFLTDASLPATSWEAEQAIRPAVVNRKVWGGNRTERGARAQGVLSSVLRTCGQQNRSGLEFVSHSLRAFQSPILTRPVLLPTR